MLEDHGACLLGLLSCKSLIKDRLIPTVHRSSATAQILLTLWTKIYPQDVINSSSDINERDARVAVSVTQAWLWA